MAARASRWTWGILLLVAGAAPPAFAQDDGDVAPSETRALLQRLDSLEAEVQSLRDGGVQPASHTAAALPDPGPALVESSTGYFQTPAAAPPKPKYPTVQVNGVFQAEMGFFNQDANSLHTYAPLQNNGPIQNGADFRRARLNARGSLSETVNYFFQMDFAFFGRPTFTDVWVEQTEVPLLGAVRVGQWKQPFSLEVVSSFRYTTFLERSVLFQAFTPFRHLGVGFYDKNEDLTATWAASVFTTGQDQFGDSIANAGGVGTAERITWLPYWDEASNGRCYLHAGLGHYLNAPPNHSTSFRTIPELYIGQNAAGAVGTSQQAAPGAFNGTPPFVNTGSLTNVNAFNVIGKEVLWVNGPLSFQSEAMVNFVSQSGGTTATLWGAYGQVGYFLTGEHRPYDRKAGAIDRVMPFHDFDPRGGEGGWGAWEVAGRISYLDLNDKNIRGGTLNDYTVGVNWFINPNWKIAFNYIRANSKYQAPGQPYYGPSSTNIVAMMCQIDF